MARKRKRASSSSSGWPDLPPDLLGVVLRRLHSHTDRVRVAAVCRPWRFGARLQLPLPPPMPWVVLGESTYIDPNTRNRLDRCFLTVGDRLFVRRSGSTAGGGHGYFLMNPLLSDMEPMKILGLASFLPV
uniref:F-box domain-containing protein n=1 Tax=Oryza punctata TaxID=4537 RepID=A0A0E0L7V6_ORYPU